MRGLRFVSIARYVPEKVVTNDDLSRIVDTNDEWIRTRTGIGERHFSDGETSVDLCAGAARLALERAGIAPEELAGCVVATCTPDHASPANACLVQAAWRASGACWPWKSRKSTPSSSAATSSAGSLT